MGDAREKKNKAVSSLLLTILGDRCFAGQQDWKKGKEWLPPISSVPCVYPRYTETPASVSEEGKEVEEALLLCQPIREDVPRRTPGSLKLLSCL